MGATVNAMRSSRVAWATGSSRTAVALGTGVGRRAAMALLMGLLLGEGRCFAPFATPRRPVLPRVLRSQLAQALVVLAAGRAARQMRRHARHPRIGRRPAELELDVRVELLEALVAAQLGRGRAERAREELVMAVLVHRLPSSQLASISKPRSASAARSFRRAS